jgi:hypothetical protein
MSEPPAVAAIITTEKLETLEAANSTTTTTTNDAIDRFMKPPIQETTTASKPFVPPTELIQMATDNAQMANEVGDFLNSLLKKVEKS